MNLADYYRCLARDMAEAKRKADLDPESSCWEQMEIKLATLQFQLDSSAPARQWRPRKSVDNVYDVEHRRATNEAGKRRFLN